MALSHLVLTHTRSVCTCSEIHVQRSLCMKCLWMLCLVFDGWALGYVSVSAQTVLGRRLWQGLIARQIVTLNSYTIVMYRGTAIFDRHWQTRHSELRFDAVAKHKNSLGHRVMFSICSISSYIILAKILMYASQTIFWTWRLLVLCRTRPEKWSNFVLVGYSMISSEVVGDHLKLVAHSTRKTSAWIRSNPQAHSTT